MCGKEIYQDKDKAAEVLKAIHERKRRKHLGPRIPNQVYWCEECGGYHVASPRKRGMKNKTFRRRDKWRK